MENGTGRDEANFYFYIKIFWEIFKICGKGMQKVVQDLAQQLV